MGALDPAGQEAQRIADLFWWMAGGGALIWVAVVAVAIYATYFRHPPIDRDRSRRLVVVGGVVVPIVALTVLLVYGLAMIPPLLAPTPEGTLRIHVTGEQWWWRVRYDRHGEPIELANEIRLPVGRPAELQLDTRDVIHSLWIPALGGKADMIPGRRTRLRLHPTRTGVFRGICAEYCGASHAWMLFSVRVVEEEEFARWLDGQARGADPQRDPLAARGRELFLANGCGACHTVRGMPAEGRVGPDLTHVGGRDTLAAGRLANEPDDFQRWIAEPTTLKPGAHMPAFGMLPAEDRRALAAFLESLR